MAEFFHIEYDKLEQVAQAFQQQAQCMEDVLKQLQQAKSRLDQSWSGDAYNQFNEEMLQTIFPKITKFQNALTQAGQLITKLADQNRTYENTAKGLIPQAQMVAYFMNR